MLDEDDLEPSHAHPATVLARSRLSHRPAVLAPPAVLVAPVVVLRLRPTTHSPPTQAELGRAAASAVATPPSGAQVTSPGRSVARSAPHPLGSSSPAHRDARRAHRRPRVRRRPDRDRRDLLRRAAAAAPSHRPPEDPSDRARPGRVFPQPASVVARATPPLPQVTPPPSALTTVVRSSPLTHRVRGASWIRRVPSLPTERPDRLPRGECVLHGVRRAAHAAREHVGQPRRAAVEGRRTGHARLRLDRARASAR